MKKVVVTPGDVIVVPPGVVHGWADIPDHVEYLSVQLSQNVLHWLGESDDQEVVRSQLGFDHARG